MNSDELKHRFQERVHIEADRLRFHLGWDLANDREFQTFLNGCRFSMKSYLAGAPSSRFYLSGSRESIEGIVGFTMHHFPEWIENAVQDADRLSKHHVNLLGRRDVFLGPEIDWHVDPISHYRWPKTFWAACDLAGDGKVDPKVIHELNRHQYLPRLAKAYLFTGEERYALECVHQMESWIQHNPPSLGVNWQSSLEIALRALSWMWTIFLLLPSSALDEPACRRIMQSLFCQLDHVYRYPSVYSSPNTHLTGEAAALFIGGLLFSEFPRAAQWRGFGATTLVNEMQKQVSVDGVYGEASIYYHCYTADFYLQAMTLCRINRVPFPEWMWRRLSDMHEFVLHVTRPDGSLPLMGDDDGGRALALQSEDYTSFRDGLSSAAVLFGRGDFKHAAREYAQETMWLLGEKSFEVFDSIDAGPQNNLGRSYPGSGYFIQRSGWGPTASHLVFDCGNLGMLSGGHGHADALSFTLSAGGKDLLIDPGTSVYNGAPEWRQFFRSTAAHNTVVVDGSDQSETAGTFSWRRKSTTRLIAHRTMDGIDYVDAEHDGYLHMPLDLIHRRRILFVRPDYWIIFDELQGRGAHNLDFLFHFAPGVKLFVFGEESRGHVECGVRLDDTALQMFMHASGPLHAEAIYGQSNPMQGWASGRYGELKPAPVLSAKMQSFAPASAMTILAPHADKPHSQRLTVKSECAGRTAIAATFGDRAFEDTCIFVPDGATTVVGDCTFKGEIVWIRSQDGALKEIIAINAKQLSLGGETIFESEEPVPYVLAHVWENSMVIERGEEGGKVYVRDLRYRQFQRN